MGLRLKKIENGWVAKLRHKEEARLELTAEEYAWLRFVAKLRDEKPVDTLIAINWPGGWDDDWEETEVPGEQAMGWLLAYALRALLPWATAHPELLQPWDSPIAGVVSPERVLGAHLRRPAGPCTEWLAQPANRSRYLKTIDRLVAAMAAHKPNRSRRLAKKLVRETKWILPRVR